MVARDGRLFYGRSMARIPYVDPASASPEVRAAFDRLGLELNIFRLVAHAETAFEPFLRFAGTLLTRLQLEPVLRELAILEVARLSGAEYEWVQHAAIATAVGVTDEQVAAVQRGELDASCLSDLQRTVLRFTRETLEQVGVSQETFERASAHLSPREIVELLLVVGAYRMLAGVMESCAIDLDPAVGAELLERRQR
jgi:4-carboxymuconolactone decarboxylase